MTLADIETIIATAIKKVQEDSGRAPAEVSSGTRPVQDIPDFDSLNEVEVTLEIEKVLGVELGVPNIFAGSGKELSVREAAERILKILGK